MSPLRKPLVSILLPAFVMLALAGCAGPAGNSSYTLTGTPWTLVGLGENDWVAPVPGAAPPTLQLTAGTMRVSGFAGVNQFTSEFTLKGGQLVFGPIALTRMAGAPELMDAERRYTAALAGTTNWRIRNDHLELMTAQYVLARFAPGPAN